MVVGVGARLGRSAPLILRHRWRMRSPTGSLCEVAHVNVETSEEVEGHEVRRLVPGPARRRFSRGQTARKGPEVEAPLAPDQELLAEDAPRRKEACGGFGDVGERAGDVVTSTRPHSRPGTGRTARTARTAGLAGGGDHGAVAVPFRFEPRPPQCLPSREDLRRRGEHRLNRHRHPVRHQTRNLTDRSGRRSARRVVG